MRRTWRLPRLALLCSIVLFLSCEEACKVANNVGQFIDSISDGAPCEDNFQCLGQRCLSPEQGYPGGYCTTLNCDVEGCSGLSSECFRLDVDGQSDVATCVELCDFDGACDRAAEGYICVTLQDTAVCLPPDISSDGPIGATGSACSTNTQCNGDNAVCLTNNLNGYCSQTCTADTDCLGGNPCLSGHCFLACDSSDDCRFNYTCQDYEGTNICNRAESAAAVNPDGANDGAECASRLNCKGGACIVEAEVDGEIKSPGGYCTTRDCNSDEDCNGGVCVARGLKNACLAGCSADSDCRTGYTCVETPNGSVCDTDFDRVTPDTSDAAFEVTCGPSKTFNFTVPAGSVGFFVGPYTKGLRVEPRTLTGPGNYSLDIQRDYDFLAINPDILGNLSPIMFPGTDNKQPPFRADWGAGDWSLAVETNASEVCFYMVPQPKVGTKLDVNLYLVGVPGLTAANAKDDPDIREAMDSVKAIYTKMNVTASIANYIDVEPSVAASYSIIRDFNDVFNLVATSTPQGSSAADQLTVNVFLIDDFNVAEAKGLLGVSSGIPGMAGLHGTNGSGLVFSSASLGEDNQQLGQTMAHEIGHFLGLRHTTEHGLIGTPDPITDTPSCLNVNGGTACADSDNFMFAFALGGKQQTVSPGQAYVVTRNPLVK